MRASAYEAPRSAAVLRAQEEMSFMSETKSNTCVSSE